MANITDCAEERYENWICIEFWWNCDLSTPRKSQWECACGCRLSSISIFHTYSVWCVFFCERDLSSSNEYKCSFNWLRVFAFWTENLEPFSKFKIMLFLNFKHQNRVFNSLCTHGTRQPNDYWIVGIVIWAIKLIKNYATTAFELLVTLCIWLTDHLSCMVLCMRCVNANRIFDLAMSWKNDSHRLSTAQKSRIQCLMIGDRAVLNFKCYGFSCKTIICRALQNWSNGKRLNWIRFIETCA